ncbi:MAG TPA: hypothetical protein PLX35_17065 [Cyclobacteriaceae bacterium]|nr:hypothetical protein [Cyclobacteriaceae bacterium]
MIRILYLLILLMPLPLLAQQLAPSFWRPMVGKTCKAETDFSQLSGFTFFSGTVISDSEDPEQKQVHVFKKGLTAVIFFIIRQDDSRLFILDAVEIRNLSPDQEISIGTCREGDGDMPGIVALVKRTPGRWRALKSWHFDMNKLKVTLWPPNRVTCLPEQGED